MPEKKKYRCPCCGYYTMDERPGGTFEICPVCFWEDDDVQLEDEDYAGGANKVSLAEARRNFLEFGACEREYVKNVRPPRESEMKGEGPFEADAVSEEKEGPVIMDGGSEEKEESIIADGESEEKEGPVIADGGSEGFLNRGMIMEKISINEIKGIRIGQIENTEAATGCTVFISDEGMRAGLDVRGGGPASRDSQLLNPLMAADCVHAIVLGGGSAFGLGATDGVQAYLEEKGIGFDVGVTKVPLVVQSDIFDLTVGDMKVRPDRNMGYEAARTAFEAPNYRDGNFGGGIGATVGKYCGMETCMKTGIGSYAVRLGALEVGAVVILNALGDVFDYRSGKKVAGLLKEDKTGFRDTMELMKANISVVDNKFTGNTTIGLVMTNAAFDKASLCKIAGMTHDGFARSINPVHTSADGDSIYAVSLGDLKADRDVVGALAAEVMSEAILCAVRSARSAYGFPAAADLDFV